MVFLKKKRKAEVQKEMMLDKCLFNIEPDIQIKIHTVRKYFCTNEIIKYVFICGTYMPDLFIK